MGHNTHKCLYSSLPKASTSGVLTLDLLAVAMLSENLRENGRFFGDLDSSIWTIGMMWTVYWLSISEFQLLGNIFTTMNIL